MSEVSDEIYKFKIDIPKADIEDLKRRLGNTRWPDAETPDDWSQGLPLKYHQAFCQYWASEYDWYKTQDRLNKLLSRKKFKNVVMQ